MARGADRAARPLWTCTATGAAPGFEYKEDVETGSRAAAAGGYTFVNLMPNTKPVCSSAAQAMQVEQKAAEVGLCDVEPDRFHHRKL